MPRHLSFVFLLFAVSLLEAAPRKDQPKVQIGKHSFAVEIAKTPEEWSRGLMFREKLAPHAGMLFWGKTPRVQRFWMKNTLIPLDIIFISKDLKIINIAEMTTPHSLDPVFSKKPALHVLEIKGGESKKRGIKAGMSVKVPGTIGAR